MALQMLSLSIENALFFLYTRSFIYSPRLAVVKGDICAGIGTVVGNVIPVFLQLLFKNIMHFGRTALLKQSAQAKVDFGGILHQRTDFGRHGVAVQHQAEAEFFDDFVNQLL